MIARVGDPESLSQDVHRQVFNEVTDDNPAQALEQIEGQSVKVQDNSAVEVGV
jgi:hypothetical protein